MDNRYLQKIVMIEGKNVKEFYLDVEYRRDESTYKSVDIKEVTVHRAFENDSDQHYLLAVDEKKREKYDIEEGFFELIRGGFREIELEEETRAKMTEIFIDGIVHTKMCEAVDSFVITQGGHSNGWTLPASESL